MYNVHVLAEVKSIHVELVEPRNPYGQTRSAEITVDGPLLPIQPLREQDRMLNWSSSNSPERFSDDDGLFALVVCICDWGDHEKKTCGLVLTRVSLETYRRVGLIHLTDIDSTKLESCKIERVRII
jgi:hypothetical protein